MDMTGTRKKHQGTLGAPCTQGIPVKLSLDHSIQALGLHSVQPFLSQIPQDRRRQTSRWIVWIIVEKSKFSEVLASWMAALMMGLSKEQVSSLTLESVWSRDG